MTRTLVSESPLYNPAANQPPDKEISTMADNILPNGLDADVLKEWEQTATEAARQYAAEHPGADVKEIVVAGAKTGLDRVTRRTST
jgi:hypothetical protein